MQTEDQHRQEAVRRAGENPAYIALNLQVLQAIDEKWDAQKECLETHHEYKSTKGKEARRQALERSNLAHGRRSLADRRYEHLDRAADALLDALIALELG